VASAQQAARPSEESAVRYAPVVAAGEAPRVEPAVPQQEAAAQVAVLPLAVEGVPVAAAAPQREAEAAERVAAAVPQREAVRAGAAAPRRGAEAAVLVGPGARRRAARLLARPFSLRHLPSPARAPAERSAPETEGYRTALPSAWWWQAAQGEVLS
jgi:hypothetical protein